MEPKEVLEVVLREMMAYAYAWRNDWSDFDGKTLRDQLADVVKWAGDALRGTTNVEYKRGSEFYSDRKVSG